MGLFKKKGAPALTNQEIVQLMRAATEQLNYDAVKVLHRKYSPFTSADNLWDWWIDQANTLAQEGNNEIASLAIRFARAANVEPWGPLTHEQYDRMRQIETI